jgi:pseudouridine synthase
MRVNIVRYLMSKHGVAARGTEQQLGFSLTRANVQELLRASAVQVNGVAILDAQDCFVVDGQDKVDVAPDFVARMKSNIRVYAVDKKTNVDSCLNEGDRTSLLHVLRASGYNLKTPGPAGVITPIGRLDKDSQGLLLLTNSGALTERVLSPGLTHEKEYLVQVSAQQQQQQQQFPEGFLEKMRSGVSWKANGGVTETSLPCRVEPVSAAELEAMQGKKPRGGSQLVFRIVLCEGLNRQVRHMTAAASNNTLSVSFLRRIRIGPLKIDDIDWSGGGEIVEIVGEQREALFNWAFGGAVAAPAAASAAAAAAAAAAHNGIGGQRRERDD